MRRCLTQQGPSILARGRVAKNIFYDIAESTTIMSYSSADYERARTMAINEAAREATSGFLRGKSQAEKSKRVEELTQKYLCDFTPAKKKSYTPSTETYLRHFESNNRY